MGSNFPPETALKAMGIAFVDLDHPPGWLKFSFLGGQGEAHELTEKLPVLGLDDLGDDVTLPFSFALSCTVLKKLDSGLIEVRLAHDICDEAGNSVFVVMEDQLLG